MEFDNQINEILMRYSDNNDNFFMRLKPFLKKN